jgi:serine-type D-Ala-D-Ala carboxypeptidase/endopeptidase (penicillin-binding protein 4)
MRRLILLSAILLSLSVQASDHFRQSLDNFLKSPVVRNAVVSICIADTKNDSILYETSPMTCTVPASVQKLITSATGLEIVGPEFRFTTSLWANGDLSNGKISGDLVITGGGDPTLGSEYFCDKKDRKKFLSDWVSLIKKKGVDTITGNIVADPYIFPDQDVPGSWLWEDIGNYYGAASSGISIYDNIFEIQFSVPSIAGRTAEIIKIEPEIPGLTVKNEVQSSVIQRNQTNVFGSPFDSYRLINGTLPAGSGIFPVKAAVPDPALLLASELKKMLEDSSVVILGGINKRQLSPFEMIDTSKILVLWQSPPLKDIISEMNKESVNLFAETILREIGQVKTKDGSTESGIKVLKEFWGSRGIDTTTLFLADGSGLSRADAFTSGNLVSILLYMKNKSNYFDNYLESIPITGIEGTQKGYFQDSPLKGKAHAKTGSMTRVRSMAGYMTTKGGKELAFTIMINNYYGNSSAIKRQLEELLDKIYLEL